MMRRIQFTDDNQDLMPALWVGVTLGGNAIPRREKGGSLREIITAEASIIGKLKAISHERERTELELLQIAEIAEAKGITFDSADGMVPRERVLTSVPCVLDLTQAEHARVEQYLEAYSGWLTTGAEKVKQLLDLVSGADKVDEHAAPPLVT